MRGKKAPKRKIQPDIRYSNVNVEKFINYLMVGGKKSVARGVVYGAFDIIKDKTKINPVELFDKAFKNISPVMEVRGRRIGGANYQIPVQVRTERRFLLSARWLIEAAQARKGRSMAQKLAEELMDAANQTGAAIKKKENVHKMAESNRAFAHFAR
ncbi:MAG TPA: 30S ribosomal protein S7 [Patescibacteria group bacterium]